jgi:uncharacterized protein YgiM (DUF1202 family)
MTARVDDGGRESVDGRLFTDLLFADGQEFIRYRTLDNEGNLAPVAGLMLSYIDPTDGPWSEDRGGTMTRISATAINDDTDAPPSIITRAQWGANENLRFDSFGEIWPSEYETVQHAIVHHAAVNYGSDGYNAVRSIYYYHCVTQGWGDIGYNYLVDPTGKIFEGRVGGQNVIGGHAFEYAIGSSGICVIGDFQYQDATNAAKASLAYILAFVTRDLDTYATKPFHEVPKLPTICAHRDVNQTSCPGNFLYADLPEIRDTVAATLDAGLLDTGNPAGIVPGDQVKVQTDDGEPLNMRSGGSLSSPVNGSIPNGTLLRVLDGPITDPNDNWYKVRYGGKDGWVSATYLIVTPPPPIEVPAGDYAFGLNMRFTAATNVRNKPSTSASILGTAARNTWTFIMAGPIEANNYTWYQLRVPGLGDGWAIKDNILPAPVDESPAAKFKVGADVSAIRTTSVRARPGAAQTVASTATAGTRMKISVAPIAVTGYIWYGVFSDAFGGGWVIENDLQGTAPPPTGDLKAGDTIRVTEVLNMRSGAGTTFGIVATLAVGTTGKVLAGPRTGNGYTWYQIQTSAGSGWVVRDWIAKTTPTTPPPASSFSAGDTVRITEALNLRSGPGLSYGTIATMQVGMTGTVVSGYPRSADGYSWSYLQTSSGRGWAAHTGIEKTTANIAPSLKAGDQVRVTEPLNMRSSYDTSSSIVATLAVGVTGTVISGYSRSADGYMWSLIQTTNGRGWVVNVGLAKVSATPPPATGKFAIGATIRVTESLYIRTGAGTGNAIVATLPAGTTGTVLEGPRTGSGYTWWRIQTSLGTGWGVQDWLAASTGSTPPPASGAFGAGDTFRVTEALNLRSGAGTGFGIVATLPVGATGTITASSRSANGYTWWPVRTSYGSGWVVQNFIRKV